MNSEHESSLKIDQLAGELSALMAGACGMLKQCESKLLAFKEYRELERGGSIRLLASELNALFAATAERYHRAREKAGLVRSLLDSLLAQARRRDAIEVDDNALLSGCLNTDRSLKRFEMLIAEFEQQIQGSIETVNRAASERGVALSAAGAFDRFMDRVYGRQPDRTD